MPKQIKVFHIVPGVPPTVNGLSEYCYELWKHWPQPRPEWHCLAAQVPEEAHSLWPQVEIAHFDLNRDSLLNALESAGARDVVLHYVGYAYHPKGVPLWLPKALQSWKQHHQSGAHLTVMFHELYAKGSWRRTSFWLSPVAKHIMKDLAQLADKWVTSCPDYVEQINRETSTGVKGTLIPVGANIKPAETLTRLPWNLASGKKLKVVFFGMVGTRLWSLQCHENLLREMCEQKLVEQITLLGKKDESSRFYGEIKALKSKIGFDHLWNESYDCSLKQISEILSVNDLGFVSNEPGNISKSLVYAALCAHSVLPVASARANERERPDYPCVVNDDARPEVAVKFFKNEAEVQALRTRIETASRTSLNWEKIAAQWVEVLRGADSHTTARG